MRVVQRGPSVMRVQTRRTCSDRKIASKAGSIITRRAENPKAGQPEGVHQHDRRIVPGSDLDGALRHERRGIAAREIKFRNPLRGDQAKKNGGGVTRLSSAKRNSR